MAKLTLHRKLYYSNFSLEAAEICNATPSLQQIHFLTMNAFLYHSYFFNLSVNLFFTDLKLKDVWLRIAADNNCQLLDETPTTGPNILNKTALFISTAPIKHAQVLIVS